MNDEGDERRSALNPLNAKNGKVIAVYDLLHRPSTNVISREDRV